MKSIQILRAILGFVYFFAWFAAIGSLILFIEPFTNRGVQIAGYTIFNIHWSFYIIVVFIILGNFCFVAMLYHLKKAAWVIKPRFLFNEELSVHLFHGGWLCIAGILLTKIPVAIYFYSIQIKSAELPKLSRGMSLGMSYDSLLVIVAFGLFLLILSKMVKEGFKLKEENKLTI